MGLGRWRNGARARLRAQPVHSTACSTYGSLPAPRHGYLVTLPTGIPPAKSTVVESGEPTKTATSKPDVPAANAPPATSAVAESSAKPTTPAVAEGSATPAASAVAAGSATPTASAVVEGPATPTVSAVAEGPAPPTAPPATPPSPFGIAPTATSVATYIAHVDSAPVPAPPAPLSEPIPPPRRAAMTSGIFAPALPPDETRGGGGPPPRKRIREKQAGSAPTADHKKEEEEPVVVGELLNPEIAVQITAFVQELSGSRRYIGVFAFLLLALSRRMRIWVWQGAQRQEIVEEYAPWALDFMVTDAPFEAIACQSTDKGLLPLDVGSETNHWVGCVKAELGAGLDSAEEAGSDAGAMFHAVYLSLSRVVVPTVMDGDCGFDVMCLMAGRSRS